jgi:hypothetical protein
MQPKLIGHNLFRRSIGPLTREEGRYGGAAKSVAYRLPTSMNALGTARHLESSDSCHVDPST